MSTENLSSAARLNRAPSLPRSYRNRSGIPVAHREVPVSKGVLLKKILVVLCDICGFIVKSLQISPNKFNVFSLMRRICCEVPTYYLNC